MSADSISAKIHRLAKEKKTSIRQLSINCGFHANTIQNAMHRDQISKDIAAAITKQYPDISLDWLLGDAEYMNEADYERARAEENSKEAERMERTINTVLELAKLRGFAIRQYQAPTGETCYQIERETWNRKICASCSANEYASLLGDIWGYLEFRLNRFISEHGIYDMEDNNG